MKKAVLLFSILLTACGGGKEDSQAIRTVERLSTTTRNAYYVSNREPLQPQQFIKLPAGSIEPEGWIRKQLELQKAGLCGHLGEISAWLQKDNNAWLKTGGEWGWEEVPYWLRGYGNMGYALKDEAVLKETRFWIEAILSSQRADGNFGPLHLNDGKQDFWPNMIVLWIMQSYYEYTNDERVIDFMTRYCHYLLTVPPYGRLDEVHSTAQLAQRECRPMLPRTCHLLSLHERLRFVGCQLQRAKSGTPCFRTGTGRYVWGRRECAYRLLRPAAGDGNLWLCGADGFRRNYAAHQR